MGRAAAGSLSSAIDDFAARIDRLARLTMVAHRNGRSPEEEGRRLLDRLGDRRFVALDPEGRALKAAAFEKLIRSRLEGHPQELTFVIGGADGLAPEVRARAEQVVSLSGLTFSHDLARMMLLEQLYRALSTITGSPYAK